MFFACLFSVKSDFPQHPLQKHDIKCLFYIDNGSQFVNQRLQAKMKIAIILIICCVIPSIHSLAFGLGACCTTACGAEAVAISSATGGIAAPVEILHFAACFAECVSTGGFIITLLAGGAPVPVCTWSIFLPF